MHSACVPHAALLNRKTCPLAGPEWLPHSTRLIAKWCSATHFEWWSRTREQQQQKKIHKFKWTEANIYPSISTHASAPKNLNRSHRATEKTYRPIAHSCASWYGGAPVSLFAICTLPSIRTKREMPRRTQNIVNTIINIIETTRGFKFSQFGFKWILLTCRIFSLNDVYDVLCVCECGFLFSCS